MLIFNDLKRKRGSYGPVLKALSAVLIFSFFLQDLSFAYPDLKTLISETDPAKASKAWAKEFLPALPESVAVIEDAWKGPEGSGPSGTGTVVLIQDAHTNDSGQINLAKTLDIILKGQMGSFVFVEGGFGNDSLSFLRGKASLADRKRVAMSYLRKGILHGEEYLDLTSDHNFQIWGVEDAELYQKAIESYKTVANQRAKFENYLNQIQTSINVLKPRILNEWLLAFDNQVEKYQRNEIPLTDYIEILDSRLRGNDNRTKYPELEKLKKLSALEKRLKLQNVSARHQKAIVERMLKRSKAINYDALVKEQKNFESEVFESLIQNSDERTLLNCAKQLSLLKKLFNFQLNPEEYDEFKKSPLDLTHLTGFLNKKIMDQKNYYENATFLNKDFEAVAKTAEAFYELTLKRDEKFIENMLRQKEQQRVAAVGAILITGGYHTTNLKALLKSKNISYISLRPQVLRETNQKRYEQLLLNQKINPSSFTAARGFGVNTARLAAIAETPYMGNLVTELGARLAKGHEEEGFGRFRARKILSGGDKVDQISMDDFVNGDGVQVHSIPRGARKTNRVGSIDTFSDQSDLAGFFQRRTKNGARLASDIVPEVLKRAKSEGIEEKIALGAIVILVAQKSTKQAAPFNITLAIGDALYRWGPGKVEVKELYDSIASLLPSLDEPEFQSSYAVFGALSREVWSFFGGGVVAMNNWSVTEELLRRGVGTAYKLTRHEILGHILGNVGRHYQGRFPDITEGFKKIHELGWAKAYSLEELHEAVLEVFKRDIEGDETAKIQLRRVSEIANEIQFGTDGARLAINEEKEKDTLTQKEPSADEGAALTKGSVAYKTEEELVEYDKKIRNQVASGRQLTEGEALGGIDTFGARLTRNGFGTPLREHFIRSERQIGYLRNDEQVIAFDKLLDYAEQAYRIIKQNWTVDEKPYLEEIEKRKKEYLNSLEYSSPEGSGSSRRTSVLYKNAHRINNYLYRLEMKEHRRAVVFSFLPRILISWPLGFLAIKFILSAFSLASPDSKLTGFTFGWIAISILIHYGLLIFENPSGNSTVRKRIVRLFRRNHVGARLAAPMPVPNADIVQDFLDQYPDSNISGFWIYQTPQLRRDAGENAVIGFILKHRMKTDFGKAIMTEQTEEDLELIRQLEEFFKRRTDGEIYVRHAYGLLDPDCAKAPDVMILTTGLVPLIAIGAKVLSDRNVGPMDLSVDRWQVVARTPKLKAAAEKRLRDKIYSYLPQGARLAVNEEKNKDTLTQKKPSTDEGAALTKGSVAYRTAKELEKYDQEIRKQVASGRQLTEGEALGGIDTFGARLAEEQVRGEREEGRVRRSLLISNKFFPIYFDIFQDFLHKAAANVFAFVKRHGGRTTVGMAEADVTGSLVTDLFKAKNLKNANDLDRLERGKTAQTETWTSWSPTKWEGLNGFFSSFKQILMTSLMRFKSVLISFAWVWQAFKLGTLATKNPSSSASMMTIKFKDIFSSADSKNSTSLESHQAGGVDGARLAGDEMNQILDSIIKIARDKQAPKNDRIWAIHRCLMQLDSEWGEAGPKNFEALRDAWMRREDAVRFYKIDIDVSEIIFGTDEYVGPIKEGDQIIYKLRREMEVAGETGKKIPAEFYRYYAIKLAEISGEEDAAKLKDLEGLTQSVAFSLMNFDTREAAATLLSVYVAHVNPQADEDVVEWIEQSLKMTTPKPKVRVEEINNKAVDYKTASAEKVSDIASIEVDLIKSMANPLESRTLRELLTSRKSERRTEFFQKLHQDWRSFKTQTQSGPRVFPMIDWNLDVESWFLENYKRYRLSAGSRLADIDIQTLQAKPLLLITHLRRHFSEHRSDPKTRDVRYQGGWKHWDSEETVRESIKTLTQDLSLEELVQIADAFRLREKQIEERLKQKRQADEQDRSKSLFVEDAEIAATFGRAITGRLKSEIGKTGLRLYNPDYFTYHAYNFPENAKWMMQKFRPVKPLPPHDQKDSNSSKIELVHPEAIDYYPHYDWGTTFQIGLAKIDGKIQPVALEPYLAYVWVNSKRSGFSPYMRTHILYTLIDRLGIGPRFYGTIKHPLNGRPIFIRQLTASRYGSNIHNPLWPASRLILDSQAHLKVVIKRLKKIGMDLSHFGLDALTHPVDFWIESWAEFLAAMKGFAEESEIFLASYREGSEPPTDTTGPNDKMINELLKEYAQEDGLRRQEEQRLKKEEETKRKWIAKAQEIVQEMMEVYKKRFNFDDIAAVSDSGFGGFGGLQMGLRVQETIQTDLAIRRVGSELYVDFEEGFKYQDRFIRAMNYLIPHEWAHAIQEMNTGHRVIPAPFDPKSALFQALQMEEDIRYHADEIITDALGCEIAHKIYMHSEKMPSKLNRKEKVSLAHYELTGIVVQLEKTQKKPAKFLVPFLARLQAELIAHQAIPEIGASLKASLVKLENEIRELAYSHLKDENQRKAYDELVKAYQALYSDTKVEFDFKGFKDGVDGARLAVNEEKKKDTLTQKEPSADEGAALTKGSVAYKTEEELVEYDKKIRNQVASGGQLTEGEALGGIDTFGARLSDFKQKSRDLLIDFLAQKYRYGRDNNIPVVLGFVLDAFIHKGSARFMNMDVLLPIFSVALSGEVEFESFAEFVKLFGPSVRLKASGYLCDVLENMQSSSSARKGAVKALRILEIKTPRVMNALSAAMDSSVPTRGGDTPVWIEAAYALGHFKGPSAPYVKAALQDPKKRYAALMAAQEMGRSAWSLAPDILKIGENNADLYSSVVKCLGAIGPRVPNAAVDFIRSGLERPRKQGEFVVETNKSIEALGKIGRKSRKALPTIREIAFNEKEDWHTRSYALEAFILIAGTKNREAMLDILSTLASKNFDAEEVFRKYFPAMPQIEDVSPGVHKNRVKRWYKLNYPEINAQGARLSSVGKLRDRLGVVKRQLRSLEVQRSQYSVGEIHYRGTARHKRSIREIAKINKKIEQLVREKSRILDKLVGGASAGARLAGGFDETLDYEIPKEIRKIYQRADVAKRMLYPTKVGIYASSTHSEDLFEAVLRALKVPQAGDYTLLDLGSGQAEFAIRLANRYPNLTITGIEYDEFLFSESVRLVKAAEDLHFIRRGQIHLFQGDFNDPKFEKYFRSMDLIYYIAQGTYEPSELARTLKHYWEPHTRLVQVLNDNQLENLLRKEGVSFKRLSGEGLSASYRELKRSASGARLVDADAMDTKIHEALLLSAQDPFGRINLRADEALERQYSMPRVRSAVSFEPAWLHVSLEAPNQIKVHYGKEVPEHLEEYFTAVETLLRVIPKSVLFQELIFRRLASGITIGESESDHGTEFYDPKRKRLVMRHSRFNTREFSEIFYHELGHVFEPLILENPTGRPFGEVFDNVYALPSAESSAGEMARYINFQNFAGQGYYETAAETFMHYVLHGELFSRGFEGAVKDAEPWKKVHKFYRDQVFQGYEFRVVDGKLAALKGARLTESDGEAQMIGARLADERIKQKFLEKIKSLKNAVLLEGVIDFLNTDDTSHLNLTELSALFGMPAQNVVKNLRSYSKEALPILSHNFVEETHRDRPKTPTIVEIVYSDKEVKTEPKVPISWQKKYRRGGARLAKGEVGMDRGEPVEAAVPPAATPLPDSKIVDLIIRRFVDRDFDAMNSLSPWSSQDTKDRLRRAFMADYGKLKPEALVMAQTKSAIELQRLFAIAQINFSRAMNVTLLPGLKSAMTKLEIALEIRKVMEAVSENESDLQKNLTALKKIVSDPGPGMSALVAEDFSQMSKMARVNVSIDKRGLITSSSLDIILLEVEIYQDGTIALGKNPNFPQFFLRTVQQFNDEVNGSNLARYKQEGILREEGSGPAKFYVVDEKRFSDLAEAMVAAFVHWRKKMLIKARQQDAINRQARERRELQAKSIHEQIKAGLRGVALEKEEDQIHRMTAKLVNDPIKEHRHEMRLMIIEEIIKELAAYKVTLQIDFKRKRMERASEDENSSRTLQYAYHVFLSVLEISRDTDFLKKLSEPLIIEIHKFSENDRPVLGDADIGRSEGMIRIAPTQIHINNGPLIKSSSDIPLRVREVVSHEMIHKLSTLRDASGKDLLLPIKDWVDLLVHQGYLKISPYGQSVEVKDYFSLATVNADTVIDRIRRMRAKDFPSDQRDWPLKGTYTYDYRSDPHEIVVWNALGLAEKEKFGRDPKGALEILDRNLLRSVDGTKVYRFIPTKGIWVSESSAKEVKPIVKPLVRYTKVAFTIGGHELTANLFERNEGWDLAIVYPVEEGKNKRVARYSVLKDGVICTIGRSTENDIALTSTSVSRKHARIFKEGNAIYIEDLNSSNGIFIDGVKTKNKILFDVARGARLADADGLHLKLRELDNATADKVLKEVFRNISPEQMLDKSPKEVWGMISEHIQSNKIIFHYHWPVVMLRNILPFLRSGQAGTDRVKDYYRRLIQEAQTFSGARFAVTQSEPVTEEFVASGYRISKRNGILFTLHVVESTGKTGLLAVNFSEDGEPTILETYLEKKLDGDRLIISQLGPNKRTSVPIQNFRASLRHHSHSQKIADGILTLSKHDLEEKRITLNQQNVNIREVLSDLKAVRVKTLLEWNLDEFMTNPATDVLFMDWLIYSMHRAKEEGAVLLLKSSDPEKIKQVMTRAATLDSRHDYIFAEKDELPGDYKNLTPISVLAVDFKDVPKTTSGSFALRVARPDKGSLHNVSALVMSAVVVSKLRAKLRDAGSFDSLRRVFDVLDVKVSDADQGLFADFLEGKNLDQIPTEKMEHWMIGALKIEKILQAYALGARMAAQAA